MDQSPQHRMDAGAGSRPIRPRCARQLRRAGRELRRRGAPIPCRPGTSASALQELLPTAAAPSRGEPGTRSATLARARSLKSTSAACLPYMPRTGFATSRRDGARVTWYQRSRDAPGSGRSSLDLAGSDRCWPDLVDVWEMRSHVSWVPLAGAPTGDGPKHSARGWPTVASVEHCRGGQEERSAHGPLTRGFLHHLGGTLMQLINHSDLGPRHLAVPNAEGSGPSGPTAANVTSRPAAQPMPGTEPRTIDVTWVGPHSGDAPWRVPWARRSMLPALALVALACADVSESPIAPRNTVASTSLAEATSPGTIAGSYMVRLGPEVSGCHRASR